jgi:predicted alpha/beta hydrolase family esterase
MRRILIVHGWDGYPEEGWFPWLKRELEGRGSEVVVPQLPEPGAPRIYNWVPKLAEVVGQVDSQTFFVGHSMGCQAIARFLAGLPDGVKVGGAVFVAGFFKRLTNLEDDDEVRDVADHWLTTPLDLVQVRAHLEKSVAIFSDDDPYVPLDNQDMFRDALGSKIVVEHNRGHFSGSRDKCFELPAALDSVLDLVGLSH